MKRKTRARNMRGWTTDYSALVDRFDRDEHRSLDGVLKIVCSRSTSDQNPTCDLWPHKNHTLCPRLVELLTACMDVH